MTNGYNAFEEKETAAKKPEKRGAMLSLLAGLIVVLVMISVVAYRSGVNIKQVRADIASFAAALKERYAADGVNVNLSYGTVDATGGVFHKNILIAKPILTVEQGGHQYTLSASDVSLAPADNDFHEFTATLPSPITFTRPNDNEVMRYITPAPLAFEVTTNEAGMQEYLLPLHKTSSFELERGGMVSAYDITLGETSFIAGAFSPRKSKDYALSVSLDDASITHQGAKTSFSHAAYDFTASAEEGQQTEISIEALTSDLIPASLTPIAIDATERRAIDPVTHDVSFNIEKLMVTGNAALKSSELLPLVDVRVTANGAATVVKALEEKGYLGREIAEIIISSLKRIAPEWNEQSASPLQFSVHRTATEPFMIGKMKADELLAIALKEWYVRAGTPAPAPVEVTPEPDLSGAMTPAPEGNVPVITQEKKVEAPAATVPVVSPVSTPEQVDAVPTEDSENDTISPETLDESETEENVE
jgi:hypothetical protein